MQMQTYRYEPTPFLGKTWYAYYNKQENKPDRWGKSLQEREPKFYTDNESLVVQAEIPELRGVAPGTPKIKPISFAGFKNAFEFWLWLHQNEATFRGMEEAHKRSIRNFHEKIRGRFQKPFIDIDMPNTVSEELYLSLRQGVITALRDIYTADTSRQLDLNKNFVLFDSSRDESTDEVIKWSGHIIVDGVMVLSANETDKPLELEYILARVKQHPEVKVILDQLPEEIRNKVLDPGVYSRGHCLRVMGSTKHDEMRFKHHLSVWEYKGQAIVYQPLDSDGSSEVEKYRDIFLASLISNTQGCEFWRAPTAPGAVTTYQPIATGDFNPDEAVDLVFGHESWSEDEKSNRPYTVDRVKGTLIHLRRIRKSKCIVAECNGVIHDRENACVTIWGVQQRVYFNCLRSGGKGEEQKAGRGIDCGKLKPNAKIPAAPLTDEQIFPAAKPTTIINDKEFIEWLGFKEEWEVILLFAFMGRGKTVAIIQALYEEWQRHRNLNNGRHFRVICIGPRQRFNRSLTARLNRDLAEKKGSPLTTEETFKCYLDPALKGNLQLNNFNLMVIQPESLYKLGIDVDHYCPYDLLILDEADSNFFQLTSETMIGYENTPNKNFLKNIRTFELLIRTTPRIVGGDAFLTERTTSALRAIRAGSPIQVIKLETPLPPKLVCYIEQHDAWQARFFNHIYGNLTDGSGPRRCVAVVASKFKAEKMMERIRTDNIIPLSRCRFYVAGKITTEQEAELEDVNRAWSNADVVIMTTCITVGINFDKPNHFNDLFVYSSASSACVRDIMQSTMRVRWFKNPVMFLNIYTSCWGPAFEAMDKYSHGLTVKQIQQDLMRKNDRILTAARTLDVDLGQSIHDEPNWLLSVHIANIQEMNISRKRHKDVIKYYLFKLMGYTSWIESPERVTVLNQVFQPVVDNYEDIPEINAEEAENIQNRINTKQATQDDIRKINKYNFDSLLDPSTQPFTRAQIWKDYWSNPQKRVILFMLFKLRNETQGDLLNEDAFQHIYMTFMSEQHQRIELMRQILQQLEINPFNMAVPKTIPYERIDALSRTICSPDTKRIFGIHHNKRKKPHTECLYTLQQILAKAGFDKPTPNKERIQVKGSRKTTTVSVTIPAHPLAETIRDKRRFAQMLYGVPIPGIPQTIRTEIRTPHELMTVLNMVQQHPVTPDFEMELYNERGLPRPGATTVLTV